MLKVSERMLRPEKRLDDMGQEVLSDEAVSLPVKFLRTESLVQEVQRLVRGELSRAAQQYELESFDEADDFDCGDEDPRSIHELDDDQERYDIRNDERYKRRPDATPNAPTIGASEGEQGILGEGEEKDGDKERDQSDKREAGKSVRSGKGGRETPLSK